MKTIAVALTLATVSFSTVYAVPASSMERITFNGSIVKDTCRINQQQAQMRVTCPLGPAHTTETLNLKQLAKQSSRRLASSQVSYQWIDPRHTMAVITISHE